MTEAHGKRKENGMSKGTLEDDWSSIASVGGIYEESDTDIYPTFPGERLYTEKGSKKFVRVPKHPDDPSIPLLEGVARPALYTSDFKGEGTKFSTLPGVNRSSDAPVVESQGSIFVDKKVFDALKNMYFKEAREKISSS